MKLLYFCVVFPVKVSIVLQYLRFSKSKRPCNEKLLPLTDRNAATTRTTRFLCKATLVFIGVHWIVCIIVTFLQCHPINKMWTLEAWSQGLCINTTAFWY